MRDVSTPPKRVARRTTALCTLGLFVGCTYTAPFSGPTPEPGKTLIVGLTRPIEFQLAEARLQGITRVEGRVLETTADSLILSATSLWSTLGTRHPALGAAVAVPWSDTTGVQEKRTSATRTVIVVGASLAGIVLAVLAVHELSGGSSGGGGNGTRPN